MKVIIMLGPPGAGKGTQAVRLANELGLVRIATGDMLRDHMSRNTELGQKIKPIYDSGGLVSDEIIIDMIRQALSEMDDVKVVFDGFPRNVVQAEELDELLHSLGLSVSGALLLEVPEQTLIERVLKRASLEGRSDDTAETIKNRLKIYKESTEPLINYYQQKNELYRFDGTSSPDEVFHQLYRMVNRV